MFIASRMWKTTYPGAAVGILAMGGASNPKQHAALESRIAEVEHALRARYAGQDRAALKALPTIQAYDAYYKRFKKTYHVLLQLESIVLKGRPIRRARGLVAAMFMAEVNNLLLTAGHDLEAVQDPVRVDVADGSEAYVRFDGQEQTLKPDDMYISDAQGILSSVLYGPDQRTQIRPETQQVLFTVYAPPGIGHEAVRAHLEEIRDNVLLFAPEAEVLSLEVHGTD